MLTDDNCQLSWHCGVSLMDLFWTRGGVKAGLFLTRSCSYPWQSDDWNDIAEGKCSLQQICFSEKMKSHSEVEKQLCSLVFPTLCIHSSTGQGVFLAHCHYQCAENISPDILFRSDPSRNVFLHQSPELLRRGPGGRCAESKGGLGFDCHILHVGQHLYFSSFSTVKTVLLSPPALHQHTKPFVQP